jgi:hypothetical protein
VAEIETAMRAIKSTTVNLLTVVDKKVTVEPLKNQIRRFFQWEFEGAVTRSRERSGEGRFTYHRFVAKAEQGQPRKD